MAVTTPDFVWSGTNKAAMQNSKLDGLQAGRAIAALMVVAFHANVFILPAKMYDGTTAGAAFNMGYAGVEFFFVLSGFIMYFVHARHFGQVDRAGTFLRRRALRIYPLYWSILGVVLLVDALTMFGPAQPWSWAEGLASIFLIPTADFPIMRIAWTLMHEMLFYLVFASLILARVGGTWVFGLWMLGCIVLPFIGVPSGPFSVIFSAYNLLFAFGMVAAWGFRRLTTAGALCLLGLGFGMFAGIGLSEALGGVVWDQASRTWGYGIGAAMMTAALATGIARPPRWLVFLGDASYSIYLIHLPVMSALAFLLASLGLPWGLPPEVMLVALMIISAAVGSLCFLLIERPMMRTFARNEKRATVKPPVYQDL